MTLSDFLETGETLSFSKTLTETDVSFFAAVSGDFDPLHMDESYAGSTRFKGRIAHGILTMALFSTVAAMVSQRAKQRGFNGTSVSLGFDRIRFVRPVFIGDSLTAYYVIGAFDGEGQRSTSNITIENTRQEACVVGQHVMKWLDVTSQ